MTGSPHPRNSITSKCLSTDSCRLKAFITSFSFDLVGVLPMVMDFMTCAAFALLLLQKFLSFVISVDSGAIFKKASHID